MLDMMSFAATLLPAAALTFPDVSPALVSLDLGFLGLSTFHLRWYALGYMAGIGLACVVLRGHDPPPPPVRWHQSADQGPAR